VILATGSLPDDSGFQRWLPGADYLPGIENGGVWSPEEVLRRDAKLGPSVVLDDEGGNWRGLGTAWVLAEQGKDVTIVTPEPLIGKELARTSAEAPLRGRLARRGVRVFTEHLIDHWSGDSVRIRNLLTGETSDLPASALALQPPTAPSIRCRAALPGRRSRLSATPPPPGRRLTPFTKGARQGFAI